MAMAVAGCGAERQDEDEPSGSYKLEVTEASFPARQAIAGSTAMVLEVRNADTKPVPNVAVTVETTPPGGSGGAPLAFGQKSNDASLADSGRPIWIVDREPSGGTTAYTNTWSLGRLEPGRTKRFEWQVTAAQSGTFEVAYRVAPGLDGKAKPARGSRVRGSFDVTVDEEPRDARVTDDGEIVVEE